MVVLSGKGQGSRGLFSAEMFTDEGKEVVLIETVVKVLTDVHIGLLPGSLLHLLHLLLEVKTRMEGAHLRIMVVLIMLLLVPAVVAFLAASVLVLVHAHPVASG